MSRSVIVQRVVPGGDWNTAEPLKTLRSTVACKRRSAGLCCKVMTEPLVITVPLPVKTVPLQQRRYSPVCELNRSTVDGLASSCKQVSKPPVTVTLAVATLFVGFGSIPWNVTVAVFIKVAGALCMICKVSANCSDVGIPGPGTAGSVMIEHMTVPVPPTGGVLQVGGTKPEP